MTNLKHKYFGPLSFYKGAVKLAVPVMLQLFIQSLVSLIDNFMVADLGDLKMSGVNVANHLVFIFIESLYIIYSAGGMFMSQYNGIKDKNGMQQVYRFKLILGLLFSFIFIFICIAFQDFLLGLLVSGNTAKTEIVREAGIYTDIIVFSFIPMAFSIGLASSFRETGSVKAPMYISLVSAFVNTLGNYLLIYGKLGAPRLEAAGAAYATLIARCTELIMFFLYTKKVKPLFYVKLKEFFKIQLFIFYKILKKSSLIFIADMSWVITETVATAIYNSRGGSEVVAGMSVAWTIANLFFLIFPAIGTSAGVIIGGTLGRNCLEEAKRQARWIKTGSVLLGTVTALLEFTSILLIPVVFRSLSPASHEVTRLLIIFIACYMPIWTYQNTQYAIARSGGDAIMGIWVDTSVNVFLFMPCMFLLYYFTGLPSPLMYAIAKLTSIVKTIFAEIQLKKERWVKNLTIIEK